jgi:hypothetical protein
MQAADIGIERIEVREEELQSQKLSVPGAGPALQISFPQAPPGSPLPSQKVYKVFTWHKRNETGEEVPFDLADESDGTRKLFEFTGGWLRALDHRRNALRRRTRQEPSPLHHPFSRYSVQREQEYEGCSADLHDA